MIEEKNRLINVNCSFKKLKKIINFLRYKNIFNIFKLLRRNKSKSFLLIKKILINNLKNFYSKYYFIYSNINIKYIYVNKGKCYKKIFPRAKGKCDFIKRKMCNIYLCLVYFLNG
ncbi:uL22 family ribosomal protein [Candidatus Vidania fulgoroideorum]